MARPRKTDLERAYEQINVENWRSREFLHDYEMSKILGEKPGPQSKIRKAIRSGKLAAISKRPPKASTAEFIRYLESGGRGYTEEFNLIKGAI